MSMQQNARSKAQDIAYIRFRAPDLEKMRPFLEDFGLVITEGVSETGVPTFYSRGTDGSPYVHIVEQGDAGFVGIGFKMPSRAEFELLATMDGASDIEDIDAPGGGQRVRFTDPNGYLIEGVYGVEEVSETPNAIRPPLNSIAGRMRRNTPIRLERDQPVPVNRIGHCVMLVKDFVESRAWYEQRFGLLISEEFYVEDESMRVAAFFRTDRGDIPTDHHTICLAQSRLSGVHHVAFEVDDWDSVMLGHDYLTSKGHEPHWGVGKHLLGSQIFDYWEDPYGNVLEHFTDGDMFDASHVPTLEPVEALKRVQWGPTPPDREL